MQKLMTIKIYQTKRYIQRVNTKKGSRNLKIFISIYSLGILFDGFYRYTYYSPFMYAHTHSQQHVCYSYTQICMCEQNVCVNFVILCISINLNTVFLVVHCALCDSLFMLLLSILRFLPYFAFFQYFHADVGMCVCVCLCVCMTEGKATAHLRIGWRPKSCESWQLYNNNAQYAFNPHEE